jgi:hypothetical protein
LLFVTFISKIAYSHFRNWPKMDFLSANAGFAVKNSRIYLVPRIARYIYSASFSTRNTPRPVFQRKKSPLHATEDFHHLQAFLKARFMKKLHNNGYVELSTQPVSGSRNSSGALTKTTGLSHVSLACLNQ